MKFHACQIYSGNFHDLNVYAYVSQCPSININNVINCNFSFTILISHAQKMGTHYFGFSILKIRLEHISKHFSEKMPLQVTFSSFPTNP